MVESLLSDFQLRVVDLDPRNIGTKITKIGDVLIEGPEATARAMQWVNIFKGHFVLGDFRKFAEQFGNKIGWDATNRKYILAHGMTGVDWEHYGHPLPEDVYDTYMRYWQSVDSSQKGEDT